jgi:cytochrome bd-type quinol oxidase subunit 2
MINKIKKLIFVSGSSLVFAAAVLVPSVSGSSLVFAAVAQKCNNVADSINSGANATGSTGNCGVGGTLTTGVSNLAGTITTDFSILVGAISVIMIIFAGFKYITSGGSNENTNSARNILMYAVIGLVIAVIAQLIVHLVINSASSIKG